MALSPLSAWPAGAQAPVGDGESQPIAIPEIAVQGRVERALEPVPGFVAGQSITGTKTDTPLAEVPQAVSVVTRDQIDVRRADTVADAIAYTAGTQTNLYGPSGRYDWWSCPIAWCRSAMVLGGLGRRVRLARPRA